jgi:prepilin-type N-terminal cleavage/methylation domain-containing protein
MWLDAKEITELLADRWERVSCMIMERGVLRRSAVIPHRLIRRRRDGFTLVELAVVVTIVAVLSVIALVGYRKYMLNSKITEAQSMIGGIKIAQEDHRSEKGVYANIGSTNYCPSGAGVADKKWGWDPGCNGGTNTWSLLPVHVEGPVQFAYITTAGSGAFTAPPDSAFVTWGTPAVANWSTVVAKCDLDPGGNYTVLVGSSLDNRLFTNNAGE